MAEKEYIEREAALKRIDTAIGEYAQHGEIVRFIGDCRASVIYAPAADVVSLAVFEQMKWERDTALQTLEEHGIGLAQKADVVEVRHGEWLDAQYTYFGAKRYECSLCRDDEFWKRRYIEIKENYCPNCGAKMDGEKK